MLWSWWLRASLSLRPWPRLPPTPLPHRGARHRLAPEIAQQGVALSLGKFSPLNRRELSVVFVHRRRNIH